MEGEGGDREDAGSCEEIGAIRVRGLDHERRFAIWRPWATNEQTSKRECGEVWSKEVRIMQFRAGSMTHMFPRGSEALL